MIKSLSVFLFLALSHVLMAQGIQSTLFTAPEPLFSPGLRAQNHRSNLFIIAQPNASPSTSFQNAPERPYAAADVNSLPPSAGNSNDDSVNTPEPHYANMRWASYERVTFDGHTPLTTTDIKPIGLAITSGVYAGAFLALHIYEANAWWRNDRAPFHFEEDWPEN